MILGPLSFPTVGHEIQISDGASPSAAAPSTQRYLSQRPRRHQRPQPRHPRLSPGALISASTTERAPRPWPRHLSLQRPVALLHNSQEASWIRTWWLLRHLELLNQVAAILPLRWIGQWWPPGQAATADWAAATPLSLRIGQ
ncbi:hypothetical protein U9M48_030348 [Paspalum notatum var. saurae]|uniref:Uncharacterized protein n=1 Tax=Paspalum notatum var. saurae TaxID=547442 RepID=A0AAQ3U0K5_PASNO